MLKFLKKIFGFKKVEAEENFWEAVDLEDDAVNDWSDWDRAVAKEWLDWGMDDDSVNAIPIIDGEDAGDDWEVLI